MAQWFGLVLGGFPDTGDGVGDLDGGVDGDLVEALGRVLLARRQITTGRGHRRLLHVTQVVVEILQRVIALQLARRAISNRRGQALHGICKTKSNQTVNSSKTSDWKDGFNQLNR